MRENLFTFSLFILLLGQLNFVMAQSVSSDDRRQIERELERKISSDTGENVSVRLRTTESYYISNSENGVRGQATVQGRRSNQPDISYDVVIDTRRKRISTVNWSDRQNQGYNRNDNTGVFSGPLTSGRYEIQLVATKRLLAVGNNEQVVQRSSGNTRGQQWDIEDAGNGYFSIRSADTGDVMTYEGNGGNGSTIILTNQRRNREEQLWEIRTGPDNGYYFIARNGKSMDSPSSARNDGGRMQLYNRNGEANQRFWLRRVGDLNDGQFDNRRSDRRGDRNNNRNDQRGGGRAGTLVWSGRVDDVVELEIQGNRVYPRVISGRAVASPRTDVSSSLPRREVNVDAQLLRGRGKIEILEQPSARNNFRAIIRIRDTQGGADDYEIEVRWN